MTTLLNLDPSQVPDDGNSLVYNAASKKWLPGPFSSNEITPEQHGAVGDGSADDTAAVQAAIQAAYDAGGGTVYFGGVYRCDGRIVIPNSATTAAGNQPAIRLVGRGITGPRESTSNGEQGRLDLRYAGTVGKIVSYGYGAVTIDGLTFSDDSPTPSTTPPPYWYSTLTTVKIIRCNFFGSPLAPAGAPTQDAIMLGGTTVVISNDETSPFQGYGSVIEGNQFDWIRRGVHVRTYGNSVVIRENNWWANCGGPEAMLFEAPSTAVIGGCVTMGNLIEMPEYEYGIRWVNSQGNAMIGDQFWDGNHAGVVACVRYEGISYFNLFMPAQNNGVAAMVSDANPAAISGNTLINTQAGGGSVGSSFGQALHFHALTTAYAGIEFGQLVGGVPQDAGGNIKVWRVASDLLEVDARMRAIGTQHDFGPLANAVRVGSLGTSEAWVDTVGTPADMPLNLRAKGAALIKARSHIQMQAGKVLQLASGTTASRPTGIGVGASWFDTTLGKPIWWNGTAWVDATGTTV